MNYHIQQSQYQHKHTSNILSKMRFTVVSQILHTEDASNNSQTVVPLLFTLASAAPFTSRQTCAPTARLDYYTGSTSPTSCGYDVSPNANITAGVCLNILTQGAVVYALPDKDCSLALFKGTTTCGDGVDATSVTDLPAGSGESACVVTGVLDGGRFYHGSLLLSCDC